MLSSIYLYLTSFYTTYTTTEPSPVFSVLTQTIDKIVETKQNEGNKNIKKNIEENIEEKRKHR